MVADGKHVFFCFWFALSCALLRCPTRCLASLQEALKRREEEQEEEAEKEEKPDDERCAWCAYEDDVKLFLCDGEGCGRCGGCASGGQAGRWGGGVS